MLPTQRFRLVAALLILPFLAGCMTRFDQSRFNACAPKSITLVVGYDIRLIDNPTIPENMGLMVVGGMTAVGVVQSVANREQVSFEQEVRDEALRKLKSDLETKGYQVTLAVEKSRDFHVMDAIEDKPDVLPGLIAYYQLPDPLPGDAVLFFEYKIDFRRNGPLARQKPSEVHADTAQIMYAKSKVYLFDPQRHQRIFFDEIQRGYDELSTQTYHGAITDIVPLQPLPPAPK